MTADAQYQLEISGEYALILAILRQARRDLRAAAPPQERAASVAFFANQWRYLEMLCDLVALDYVPLQEAIVRQYPALF
jgi:hypothetical protein